ncbi:MAG: hypothetical protein HY690_08535 [Chloroflexi bacterium]|nr:hypothetical protein [Chloroflexota bacterium]
MVLLLWLAMPARALAERSGPDFLRWGYYVPYAADSFDSLQQHLAELDVVALHWASLDRDGSLEVEEQPRVISLLQSFQGKVLTEVINRDVDQETAHRLLTEPAVRERALAALVELARRWDGLALDLENLAAADREAYTAFTRELRARLGGDKLLAVAVPARTRDLRAGWAGGFDYAGLSESADLVFLMAYAFRTADSPEAGPTGPLPWIQAVLEHALTQVPREKLVLGLPAYGYDWALGAAPPDPPARSVVYRAAVELARQHDQSPAYDWAASGASFRYHDGDREREVWYEDGRTFDQKLALVARFGLRGVGWWRLGGEDPAAWSVLAARASGGQFFPETGYAITASQFLDYFRRRGGVGFFGYPVSSEFRLLGSRVQLFQRAALQLGPDGGVRLMNVLDPGLLPLQRVNFSVLPAPTWEVQRQAPPIEAPDYGTRVAAWIRQVVPDTWEGELVGFQQAYFGGVDCATAFPDEPCREELLPLMALEQWGLPTSVPTRDPRNRAFVYQRFQRGVLHYDAATGATQGLLLGDYLKAVLTGRNLPPDLAQEQATAPLFRQYDPRAPLGLARPRDLPASDLRGAFQ